MELLEVDNDEESTARPKRSIIIGRSSDWPLDVSRFPDERVAIAESIRNSNGLDVCDGLPRILAQLAGCSKTSARWKISKNLLPVAVWKWCVRGTPNEVNAHCSELQGIHALPLEIQANCIGQCIFEGSQEDWSGSVLRVPSRRSLRFNWGKSIPPVSTANLGHFISSMSTAIIKTTRRASTRYHDWPSSMSWLTTWCNQNFTT